MRLLTKARALTLKHIDTEAGKRKEAYDAQAKPVDYQEGDIVWLKSIRPPNIHAGKLYPWFVGPYRVVRVIGGNVLGVTPLGHNVGTIRYIHGDRARLSKGDCAPNPRVAELLSPFTDVSEIDPNLDKETDE
jgi:hypothetical protein